MSRRARSGARHPQQEPLVTALRGATGASRKQAIALLAAANWDVSRAADNFFISEMTAEVTPPAVDATKIEAIFAKYKDEDEEDVPGDITGEGVVAFGTALGIDVMTDVAILGFAKYCGCARMGTFTRAEFVKGMSALGCDTLEALGKQLSAIRDKLLSDPRFFAEVYMFVFDFAREEGQKNLDKDMAVGLLELMLRDRFALLPDFLVFLEKQSHSVSRDTWQLILEFASTVASDLSNYNEDDAWPVVLDEFVEQLKASRAAAATK